MPGFQSHLTVASEDLQEVLQRMIKNNIKGISIVDDKMKTVANLTIVDLIPGYAGLELNCILKYLKKNL
jgi:hypothetical protein